MRKRERGREKEQPTSSSSSSSNDDDSNVFTHINVAFSGAVEQENIPHCLVTGSQKTFVRILGNVMFQVDEALVNAPRFVLAAVAAAAATPPKLSLSRSKRSLSTCN